MASITRRSSYEYSLLQQSGGYNQTGKCAVLRHGRSWVRAPAQAIGSSPGSDLDATNACGYIWWLQVCGSKWVCCHAVYSVHLYWWKRQVSPQMWPLGSPYTSKKVCRLEIHSGFETREEGHTKSKTGAISGSTNWALVQQFFLKKTW